MSATKPSYIIVFVCLPASTETKTERQVTKQGELTGESALDWETQETHRQKKNTSRGKSPRPLLLPSAFPEPREKAKESRRRSRGEEAVSTSQSFAIVSIDSSRPGEHILLLALFQLAFTLCK